MNRILHLEDALIRVETWVLVALVLVMLLLSSYNVLYRNVLVPWQTRLATSGPPVVEKPTTPPVKTDDAVAPSAEGEDDEGFGGGFGDEPVKETAGDGADGFGGGFGEDEQPESPQEEAVEKKEDEADGFGGGFGAEEKPKKEAPARAGEADDGFAGGFGSDEAEEEDGFGGGFGDSKGEDDEKPDPETKSATEPAVAEEKEVAGGPPLPGSFSASMISFINAIKLDWIDILLRQLVILVGFLGAMIATKRRKHINIDAASKLLPKRARKYVGAAMNLLSIGICILLVYAGIDLVKLGLEYPADLVHWAKEWHFQLMFPIGFGLLTLHFAVRFAVDAYHIIRRSSPQDEIKQSPPENGPKPASNEGGV